MLSTDVLLEEVTECVNQAKDFMLYTFFIHTNVKLFLACYCCALSRTDQRADFVNVDLLSTLKHNKRK